MFKCPNCGSTAQMKLTCEPRLSHTDKNKLIEGYDCGCGAHITAEYERDEGGFWTFYVGFVDYIEDPLKR